MIHELKTWPEFFDAVERGDKTFEVRLDDRGFQVGDELVLMRWQPAKTPIPDWPQGYFVDKDGIGTNDCGAARIRVRVTYKLPGGRFGINEAWCVLGFQRIDDDPTGGR